MDPLKGQLYSGICEWVCVPRPVQGKTAVNYSYSTAVCTAWYGIRSYLLLKLAGIRREAGSVVGQANPVDARIGGGEGVVQLPVIGDLQTMHGRMW